MDNNFASNLRWLRKANHMNQADIGKYVGKSQDLVSAWEKGTRKPLAIIREKPLFIRLFFISGIKKAEQTCACSL